jgi:hypothetical protein
MGLSARKAGREKPAKNTLRERISEVFLELIPEGITTIGLLGIIGLSHLLLKTWIGEDAKFFDYLKVRWVFDAGELVIMLRFLWMSIRKFHLNGIGSYRVGAMFSENL